MNKLAALILFATCIAMASCGAGGLPPGGGTPQPGVIVVSVSPLSATVVAGEQRLFTANVQGAAAGQTGVTWSVSGGGTIDSTGLFTASFAIPSPLVQVRATSQADASKFGEAAVTLAPLPSGGVFPVPFDVKTRDSWESSAAPTTVGIPLARSQHSNENTLRIQTSTGQDVPAQFEVVSRWGDNSIRWVMCDFIADLSALGGVGRYRLNNGGTGSAPAGNLVVADLASTVQVATGLIGFTVSKTAFRLFDSIRIDRDNDGSVDDECLNLAALKGVAVIEGADEYLMSNSTPTRVAVEQSGPIRATIVIEGEHRNAASALKLNFVCRITAWLMQPSIKVQYSFKNMEGHGVPAATPSAAAAQLAAVQTADALNVDVPLDFGAAAPVALFGMDGVPVSTPALSAPDFAELFQTYTGGHDAFDSQNPQPPGFNVGTGDGSSLPLTNVWPTGSSTEITCDVSGAATATGGHAPGWVQMAGTDLRVTAAIRDFWQMYPKSLRVQGDGLLRMGLWPEAAWQMQVFAGSMRTHEMLLSLERFAGTNAPAAELRFNLLNDPPIGICKPWHYRACRVFGQIGVTNETLSETTLYGSNPAMGAYFSEAVAHLGNLLFDRTDGNGAAAGHEYGLWNYGDGKTFTPVIGWENHDWGISGACFSWYAMSGNIGFFRMAEETARHFRDVVVLHSDIGLRFDYTEAGNPAVSGGKASQLGKTRYSVNNKQHDLGNYHLGENHLDVFKGAFLAEHYLLTGDTLSLDILKETFTYLRGTWKRFFDAGNGGVNSTMTAPTTWISSGMMMAAAYTNANGLNDPAAMTMANYAYNVLRTRQTTGSPNDPNGNGFADSSGDFKAWQIGDILQAMEYSQYALDSSAVQSHILNAMDWLLGPNADVYLGNLTPPQFGRFAESPGGTVDFGAPNLMIGAGFAGAYRASGSSNWRTAATNLLIAQNPNIAIGTVGDDGVRHSTFAQFFRAGPLLAGALAN